MNSDPVNADPSELLSSLPVEESRLPQPAQPRDIPNLGHTVLFFVIAVPMLIAGEYLSLWLAKISHLFGHKSYHALAVMMATDARLSIPAQTVAYALVAAATAAFFHMLWLRPFSEGIHWNAHQARTKIVRLLAVGLLTGFSTTLIGNYLPMPKSPPILMDMMRSPVGAWMMFIFGVTAAPMLEELAFRGFLLPGFVNAFRWLARKDDISPATVKWIGVPVSVVLTSIPFALLHSPQVSHAWAPLVLIGLVSVVLCVVRLLLDSLAASTVVHAAYNFTLFAGILVQTGGFTHLDKLKG